MALLYFCGIDTIMQRTTPNTILRGGSRRLRAFGGEVESVDRRACRHEEAIAPRAAETKVGDAFGKMNFSDQRAFGRVAPHAVFGGIAMCDCAPYVSIDVSTNSIPGTRREVVSEHRAMA